MLKRWMYEMRWWKWFLLDGGWPTHTLYFGVYRLDKTSRRIIIQRTMEAWEKREPAFEGTYPHRRDETPKGAAQ